MVLAVSRAHGILLPTPLPTPEKHQPFQSGVYVIDVKAGARLQLVDYIMVWIYL